MAILALTTLTDSLPLIALNIILALTTLTPPQCTHGDFGTHNTHKLTPPHCTQHNFGTHNTQRLTSPHCTHHNFGTHNTHSLNPHIALIILALTTLTDSLPCIAL